ncbi:MAG: hypothetical protein ACK417_04860 [Bacteroidia bacterium]
MNTRQLIILILLIGFNLLAGYFAYQSWQTGPEWRIVAGSVSFAGFLFVLAFYLNYLREEKRR